MLFGFLIYEKYLANSLCLIKMICKLRAKIRYRLENCLKLSQNDSCDTLSSKIPVIIGKGKLQKLGNLEHK